MFDGVCLFYKPSKNCDCGADVFEGLSGDHESLEGEGNRFEGVKAARTDQIWSALQHIKKGIEKMEQRSKNEQ